MKDLKDLGFVAEENNTDLSDLGFSPEETPKEEPGILETLGHQGLQALTLGQADEIHGAINDPIGAYKTAANLVGGNYPESETQKYKQYRDAEREIVDQTTKANPITSILATIAGGLIPGGAIAKGVGKLAGAPLTGVQTALRTGAIEGGLYGAGQSEADTAGGVAREAAAGTALGGALGGTVGQLGKFLGGNASDIASGAATKVEKGVIPDLMESKMGQRMKSLYQGGQQGIDSSSKQAELQRGVSNLTESQNILKEVGKKTSEVGKLISKNVEASDDFVPKSVTIIPEAAQDAAVSAKMQESKVVYSKQLDDVTKQLQDALVLNPTEVTAALKEGSAQIVDPDLLQKAMPYIEAKKGLLKNIQDALDENPQATLEQVKNFVTSKQPIGKIDPELESIFTQIREISTVNKLIKEATDSGIAPDPGLQQISNLRSQKTELQKIINELSPINKVKSYIPQLDESTLSEFEKIPAKELQDIIEGFVTKEGKVNPSDTYEFRNQLQSYINKMQGAGGSTKMASIAKKLEKEVGSFRKQAAGPELSARYHDLKSFSEMLKVDTAGKTKNEIDNLIAAKMASFVETSSSKDSLKAGRMDDMISKLIEANDNNPKIMDSIARIKENVDWSDIHKLKSGSEGSIFNDSVNRFLFAFPIETAGKISQNPLVKLTASTTKSTSNKLLSLPSAAWRTISSKTSNISPTLSKMANTMAETTDEGKKRAILNSLNQMPSFRKAIEDMYGNDEEN